MLGCLNTPQSSTFGLFVCHCRFEGPASQKMVTENVQPDTYSQSSLNRSLGLRSSSSLSRGDSVDSAPGGTQVSRNLSRGLGLRTLSRTESVDTPSSPSFVSRSGSRPDRLRTLTRGESVDSRDLPGQVSRSGTSRSLALLSQRSLSRGDSCDSRDSSDKVSDWYLSPRHGCTTLEFSECR